MKRVICIVLTALLLTACKASSQPATTETLQYAETETTVPTTIQATEPEVTEPPYCLEDNTFLLSFAGDCTLGSNYTTYGNMHSFIDVIGEDYGYPFRNVFYYFDSDDFTFINLEGVLADGGTSYSNPFSFHGPTAYVNILTEGSVEAVTLANNHSMDYGQEGYNSTLETLNAAGIAYVERNSSMLYTTERGLTIGVYGFLYQLNQEDMMQEVAALRAAGAEIVIIAAHWGVEGSYNVDTTQEIAARACIDAGADIVYGSHPHVLQRVEQYNGGIIFYSMGNFSFGGNQDPPDYDTAVLQQQVIRREDGTIMLGELISIPASISTKTMPNDFQPTPYQEGSDAWNRVLQKLNGTLRYRN